ncbi:MAG: lysophospholipid acyltransferase family protein [Planctomycetes bacterium]|nr:lysophospholipid acyltransferase family protein [Planctomycetota bacterium]
MIQTTTQKKKKKRKKRNLLKDWISYAGVRVLIFILHLFNIETNLRFACFLGRCLWKYYHRGRKRALNNLRESFPEKNEQWMWETGKRSFEQIVMLTVDMLFTPRLVKKSNWRDYCNFKKGEYAKWLMKEGNGFLMIAAHYSNFEIMGYMLGLFDFDAYSIARPLDNKFISDYLYGVRKRAGQKIIDKKGASAMMEHISSSGATLCFIADQDAGRKGLFVDFFGRKASTYKSIGLLAMTYNLPIGIAYSRRVGNKFYFEIAIDRVILPEEWADKDDPLRWITQEYTAEIEKFVRVDPSQYWWLHRRWKHRPKEETEKAKADKVKS